MCEWARFPFGMSLTGGSVLKHEGGAASCGGIQWWAGLVVSDRACNYTTAPALPRFFVPFRPPLAAVFFPAFLPAFLEPPPPPGK